MGAKRGFESRSPAIAGYSSLRGNPAGGACPAQIEVTVVFAYGPALRGFVGIWQDISRLPGEPCGERFC